MTVPPPGSAAEQVRTTLFRALSVLRGLLLVYAVLLNALRWDELARPGLAAGALALMMGWTAVASWAYDAPRRRTVPLLMADLAVSVALLLVTPAALGATMMERQASTLPSFWVLTPVLACTVARGWVAGLVAASVMSVVDVSVRPEVTGTNLGNLFLLVLAAGMVGYATGLLGEAAEARAAAERTRAAYNERARLSRAVHDGVLQVLSLVQRRGLEAADDPGPAALAQLAELGRLAGEQERSLRALVHGDARFAGPEGPVDLLASLSGLQSDGVTVAGPGAAVPLSGHAVEELTAAVRACLDNVARHVGPGSPAWVLVEDLGDSVVVTVRDEGQGIPEGRLARAAAEGRLGVASSIRGRMTDLGGTAVLTTAPGVGTEWELRLPR